jgi:hypothetical protein
MDKDKNLLANYRWDLADQKNRRERESEFSSLRIIQCKISNFLFNGSVLRLILIFLFLAILIWCHNEKINWVIYFLQFFAALKGISAVILLLFLGFEEIHALEFSKNVLWITVASIGVWAFVRGYPVGLEEVILFTLSVVIF